jgi:hypothetical protein
LSAAALSLTATVGAVEVPPIVTELSAAVTEATFWLATAVAFASAASQAVT